MLNPCIHCLDYHAYYQLLMSIFSICTLNKVSRYAILIYLLISYYCILVLFVSFLLGSHPVILSAYFQLCVQGSLLAWLYRHYLVSQSTMCKTNAFYPHFNLSGLMVRLVSFVLFCFHLNLRIYFTNKTNFLKSSNIQLISTFS